MNVQRMGNILFTNKFIFNNISNNNNNNKTKKGSFTDYTIQPTGCPDCHENRYTHEVFVSVRKYSFLLLYYSSNRTRMRIRDSTIIILTHEAEEWMCDINVCYEPVILMCIFVSFCVYYSIIY